MVIAFDMSQSLSKQEWCPWLLWGTSQPAVGARFPASVFGASPGKSSRYDDEELHARNDKIAIFQSLAKRDEIEIRMDEVS
jgi:hypothetical protein